MNKEDEESKLRMERSQRARWIREHILHLKRTHLAKKYDIPLSTFQTWEDVKLGGMVENGAQRLIKIYKAEGIEVSLEWLMFGTGEPPAEGMPLLSIPSVKLSEEGILSQELKFFHQLNKNAVHFIIQDDALSPWLVPGDYVAGRWHFGDDIKKTLGFPGIVQLANGNILVRVIKAGEKSDHYSLTCTNPHTTVSGSTLHQIKPVSVAPVIWLRKLKYTVEF